MEGGELATNKRGVNGLGVVDWVNGSWTGFEEL